MTVMRRRRARCSADANGAGAGSRSREPDDIFTPPAFRPSNFLTQPVVRYPTTDKVAIDNDGDIELNTGTVASAKVLTTADIFVDGSTEGLLAQLTSVTSRLAAVETQLASFVMASNGNVNVEGALSVDGNLALGTIQTISFAYGAETVDHGKSFVLISSSFAGWSISYDSNGTPTAGQMLFIRNAGTAATTDSMGYSLSAGAGALYVYDGSAWQVIMG